MGNEDEGLISRRRLRGALPALALAALLVALNMLSPLHVDDPFIGKIAERLVEHPGDPYGFEIFWVQWPQPVFEELTPPVVPYWWAAGLLLVGARTWAIKLWFAPFVVALALGLFALLRRVAPGFERPFLVLALLSPAVAPSLNLMQDVPAYGLASAGVALYLVAAAAAAGRRGDGLALLAGLTLGAGLQAKYPVLTFLAAVMLHGVVMRRPRRSTIAVVAGLVVFGGWELFGAWRYGQGMFAGQLTNSMYWVPRGQMIVPLLRLVGGTLGVAALAAALSCGLPRRVVLGLVAALLAGYALLFVAPVSPVLFGVLGLVVAVALAATVWRLLLARSKGTDLEERLVSWWLALWLGGELIGYFVTAPFPAARRVIGVSLVATLVIARGWSLLMRNGRSAVARRSLAIIATAGGLIGGLHVVVDTLEARAQREAVSAAVSAIEAAGGGHTVWYAGHWGFGEHAARAGWRPVIPEATTLEVGDWLVVPRRVDRQQFALAADALDPRFVVALPSGIPLATLPGFYAGDSTLAHLSGPRSRLEVSRVRRRSPVVTDWPTRRLTNYVLRSPPLTAATAFPALAGRMSSGTLEDRRLAAVVLGRVSGPGTVALIEPFVAALDDPDAAVRREAALGLGRIGPAARTSGRAPLARRATTDPSPEVRDAAAAALRLVEGRGAVTD